MVLTIGNHAVYINNKVTGYIGRFGGEHINRYIHLYNNVPYPKIREIFGLFHYEFNRLFKYMNGRIRNGHYTANESRDLLYLIDEIKTIQSNVRNTEYSFALHVNYDERIKEIEGFLEESGGSRIPNDFNPIDILEIEPIFILQSSVEIPRSEKKVLYPTKLIGEGSYATVHKYKDEYYNRSFVIKKAHKDLNEKEIQRFKIEFNEMKKLSSPYVIEVYNFDEENLQYIMEFADETLDEFISKNNTKIDINERVGLVRQILQAFIYINSKGVLHRDISTKNILIKKYDGLNVIKISDFGLVKRKDSCLTSKDTEFKGSLNDPKLDVFGFDSYEVRHEVFALTRLIYFVMTGKRRIHKIDNKEFEEFVNKGISDSLEDRYNNVEELKVSFNKIVKSFYE